MRRLMPIILAALLLAATACAGKQPPAPTVKAGETLVPAVLSSHCWTRGCADYPEPPSLLRAAGYQPVAVQGGATLTVIWPTRPTESITIHQWDGSKATPASLSVPAGPGIYTYSVGARWKQGSAVYVFQVEVK